jgi:hypothetical protein
LPRPIREVTLDAVIYEGAGFQEDCPRILRNLRVLDLKFPCTKIAEDPSKSMDVGTSLLIKKPNC